MLLDVVNACPDQLWSQGRDGEAPVWQVLYHALAGMYVWLRPAGAEPVEPPLGRAVAELEGVPTVHLSREQLLEFAREAKARADAFYASVEAEVTGPYLHYPKLTNLDMLLSQVRHVQHHVGYCNRMLRESGTAAAWKGTRRPG